MSEPKRAMASWYVMRWMGVGISTSMSFHSAAAQLVTLAAEGEQHGGNHDSISPWLTGGGAFVILLLLLWVTTRFNRDR